MIRNSFKGKLNICLVLSAAALMVAGCANAIPDMSTEVEQQVGEYAGVVMLRYDANHRSRLVDIPYEEETAPIIEDEEPVIEIIEEEPEEETAEEESSVTVINNTSESADSSENVSPEEFLNLPAGMSLIYQGYSVAHSYPEDSVSSYFTLDASEGKKLLVLHYNLYNQSGADVNVNFLGDGYAFKAVINGRTTRTALVTMLMDDMSTFVGNIANGHGEELVLIFEEDISTDINSIELNIKSQDGKCVVALE